MPLFSETITSVELIEASRIALNNDTAYDRRYEHEFHAALIQFIVANGGGTGTFTGLSGDVGAASNGVTTIGANVITNAKLAQVIANSIKGNNSGATANVTDLTMAQLNAMLPVVVGATATTAGVKGIVPQPNPADIHSVLKGDGTYSTPIPAWVSGVQYSVGDVLYDGTTSNNKIYSCITNHISGSTITLGNFKELSVGGSGGSGGAVSSVFTRTGSIVAVSGDYTASNITNVATATVVSTDVQSAITELDTKKQPVLISNTNIKTVNGTSLLGSGNIVITGGSGSGTLDKYNAGVGVFVSADANTVTATKSAGVFTINIPSGVHCSFISVNVLGSDVQASADGSGQTNWINIIINSVNVGGGTGLYKFPTLSGMTIPIPAINVINMVPYNVTNQSFIACGTNTVTWRKSNIANANDYVINIEGV